MDFFHLLSVPFSVHNAVSNKHEVLQPVITDIINPGGNEAKTLTSNKIKNIAGPVVEAVLIQDLTQITPSQTNTYIIKTDIQGYDCKVYYNMNLCKKFSNLKKILVLSL